MLVDVVALGEGIARAGYSTPTGIFPRALRVSRRNRECRPRASAAARHGRRRGRGRPHGRRRA